MKSCAKSKQGRLSALLVPVLLLVVVADGEGQAREGAFSLQTYASRAWITGDFDPLFAYGGRASLHWSPAFAFYVEGSFGRTHERPPDNCRNKFCARRTGPVSGLLIVAGFEHVVRQTSGAGSLGAMIDVGLVRILWRGTTSGDPSFQYRRGTYGVQVLGVAELGITGELNARIEAGTHGVLSGCAYLCIGLEWIHVLRAGVVFPVG